MKRLRLKKKYRIILGVLCISIVLLLFYLGIENYKEYLKKCDTEKGYTCNIFGR